MRLFWNTFVCAVLTCTGASASELPVSAHLGSIAYGQIPIAAVVDSSCMLVSMEDDMGYCEVPNNFGTFGLGLYVQLNFGGLPNEMGQEMETLRGCLSTDSGNRCFVSFNGRFVGLRGFHQVDVIHFYMITDTK